MSLVCLSGGQAPSDDNLHPILTKGHHLYIPLPPSAMELGALNPCPQGSSLPPPFYPLFPSSVITATASPQLPPAFCTRQDTLGLLPRHLALILEAWLKAASFVLCPGRGEGPTDLVQCCSAPYSPWGTFSPVYRDRSSKRVTLRNLMAVCGWAGWGPGRSGRASSPWSH